MITEQAKKYIEDCRKIGQTDQQIKQNLLAGGWHENDINKALGYGSVPIPTPNPSQNSGVPSPSLNQQSDSSNQTLMAVLAYLGILIIIPFLTDSKNDPFVKFHLMQGLVLIIFSIALSVLNIFLSFTLALAHLGILSFFFSFIWLVPVILVIMGIINAAQGQMKELPIIGSFGKSFNF